MVLVLLAASGCSARPRCEAYHFHRSYPITYQASAREAAAKWSTFSGQALSIVEGDPDDQACSLGVVESGSKDYSALEAEMGTAFYAAHRDTDGSIVLAIEEWHKDPDSHGREEDFATSVLMHEIAHEYGLSHIDNAPDAVMGIVYPGTNLEFNPQDREELARATGR